MNSVRRCSTSRRHEQSIAGSELAAAPCAPATLETLACFSVMSRLRKHENSTLFAKMRVYDGACKCCDGQRGSTKTSKFIKELRELVAETGGSVTDDPDQILHDLKYAPKETRRDLQLATSFSDLRYYLECPHDFYLRKVLGFAPTIDQAFGYGRGVHNLLRAIHADPKKWAAIAKDRPALEREIQKLIDRGLFYLRYTTLIPPITCEGKGAASSLTLWNITPRSLRD